MNKMIKMLPDLSMATVVNTLNKELPDLNITVEKLKNPNKAIILDLYKKLILFIYDTNSHIWKASEEQQRCCTNPEVLVESIEIINLYKITHNIISKLGEFDFHLVDIIKPEPKRTIYFLKVLVNVILFTKSIADRLLVPCFHEINKQQKEMNLLLEQEEFLKFNIENKLEQIGQLKGEIEVLVKADGEHDTTLLNDLQTKEQCLKTEVIELLETRNTFEKQLSNIQKSIEQIISEKAALREQIYDDYPEIKEKYQKLLQKKNECESKIATEKIDHATIQEKNEVLIKLETSFNELLRVISELEATFETNKKKKNGLATAARLGDVKKVYSKKDNHFKQSIEKYENERKILLSELKHLTEENARRKLKEQEYLEKCNQTLEMMNAKEKEYKDLVAHYEEKYKLNVLQMEQLKKTVQRIIFRVTNEKSTNPHE